MEITVISRETIKPSSPTPPRFKYLKLSLLDQYMHRTAQSRALFFFSAGGDAHRFRNTNMSDRLKTSLSLVLTEYYPLAGRYNDTQSIECNDVGVEYVEARVKAPLTVDQLVACPKSKELDRLVPYDAYNYGTGFKGLAGVQVTVFEDCGGMAISISASHLLMDGFACVTFMNRWAAVARGETISVAEKFTYASLFPPRDMPAVEIIPQDTEDTTGARKFDTKRFVFPQFRLNALKSIFDYESPTRVEVVSALVLNSLITASKRSSKSIFPGIALDLRTRITPRLPTDYLGIMSMLVMMKPIGPETSLSDLGMQVRKLVREFDSDYVEKLQADNASLLFKVGAQLTEFCMNNDVRRVIPLSGCLNFPVHEVDFGWGAPAMIAPVVHKYPCVILLSRNGDGIEAWVTLEEEDMAEFQSDNQILHFTQPNLFNSKL